MRSLTSPHVSLVIVEGMSVSLRSVAISTLPKHLHLENERRSHYVSIWQQLGLGALLLLGDSGEVLSPWATNKERVMSIF
jgi:hypothetical protein